MSRFRSHCNSLKGNRVAMDDQRFSPHYAINNQLNSNHDIPTIRPPNNCGGRASSTNLINDNSSFPRPQAHGRHFNQGQHVVPNNSMAPNACNYGELQPPPFFNVPPPPLFNNNSNFQSQSSSLQQNNFYSSQVPRASVEPRVCASSVVAPHNQQYTTQNSIGNYSSFNKVGQYNAQYPPHMTSDKTQNQCLSGGNQLKSSSGISQPTTPVPRVQHSTFQNQAPNIPQTVPNTGGIPMGNSITSNYQPQALMNFPPPPFPMALLQVQPHASNIDPQKAMPLTNTLPSNDICSLSYIKTSVSLPIISEESRLNKLLQKYVGEGKAKHEQKITVAEFHTSLAAAFDVLNQLSTCKEELETCMDVNEKTWKTKVKRIVELQDQLCEICDKLSDPEQMQFVMVKLQRLKKRRERKRQQKLNQALAEQQEEQDRAEKHRVVDRWYDTLREKNEQAKREEEMKKEADSILSEVRRKIYEAKRTVEKLKIFEKLRQARRENAVKKGMFILPKHDRNFEIKISNMKDVIQKQLADYEAEERALKVMLETEQEGQREEEASWRTKKLEEIQNKKHKKILSCLFGNSDPPLNSPLHYFWQNYNIANTSIENLVKIRHMWDMYLVSPDSLEGSSIPQQWVVPELPSDDVWSSLVEKNS